MKPKVFTFDPVIYPRKLYIVVTDKTTLANFDGVADDTKCYAITQHVTNKKTNMGGVMIRFAKPVYMTTNTICHESVHAALMILDYIGASPVTDENSETFAYLVGWIAKCCEEVKKQKIK